MDAATQAAWREKLFGLLHGLVKTCSFIKKTCSKKLSVKACRKKALKHGDVGNLLTAVTVNNRLLVVDSNVAIA